MSFKSLPTTILNLSYTFCINLSLVFPRALVNTLYAYALYSCAYIIPFETIQGSWGLFIGLITFSVYLHGVITYYRVIKVGPGSPIDFNELHIHPVTTNTTPSDTAPQPPSFLHDRSITVKSNGKSRKCDKCHVWKPDRAHHCSSCDICVLKMDHHCPWFACCIGFDNYKLFIQFLLSAVCYCLWCFVLSFWYVWKFIMDEQYVDAYLDLNVIINGVISMSMSLALFIFTGLEVYFLLKNLTTIEYYDQNRYKKDLQIIQDSLDSAYDPTVSSSLNVYDLGSFRENWKAVMGDTWCEWLLPVPKHAVGDYYLDKGLIFPVNEALVRRRQEFSRDLGVRGRLLGQLQETV